MKTITLALLFAMVACVFTGCKSKDEKLKDAYAALLKEQVSYSFKDPSSAQFKDVRVYTQSIRFQSGKTFTNGYGICGAVNAKNSFGGYAGYQLFVAGLIVNPDGQIAQGSIFTHIVSDGSPGTVAVFLKGTKLYCQDKIEPAE